jgi:uncharacterized protein (DUF58 family)
MIPREIIEKVRRIEITTRSIVESMLSGQYHSAFKGRGMEFSEVRPYVQGDDVRTIDWNVTARMGEPYIKKFVEERELTVMLLVDASASGDFGSVRKFKGEVAVELCAVLAFSAIRNNDRVGLLIFTDSVERYIPPKKGKNHVLQVIRELLYFKPRGRRTDIGAALQFLNQVQKKRAVVFVVSDFLSPEYAKPLRVATRRHDVIALTITDPRERELPSVGLVELEDAERGGTMLVDAGSRALRDWYRGREARRVAERTSLLRSCGVDEIGIATESDYVEPLIRFFRRRERSRA